jgi:recombination protein RecA
MAYVKREKVEKAAPNPMRSDTDIMDIFAEVDKLNLDSALLSEDNSLSIVSDWIDTGSYSLNAIFSGSLYKGVPVGRITGFVGPSSSGKTLIVNKIIANAQKKGYFAAVWDTEAAVDRQTAEGIGVDPKRLKYYPVESVEDCRNQIALFLDKIIAANDPTLKVIIAIDSLGNLASAKELRDVQEGKDAADMGLKAKAMKSMMRALTFKAAKAKVPILFTNHIYDNPASMYPELVKKQSGGSGPLYLASLLVQLSVRNEKIDKNEDQESIAVAHSVSGVTLAAMTVKNRFAPPFLKAELYNNFRTGLSRYAGLKEMAIQFGLIQASGPTFLMNGEKIGYAKTWENDPEFWEKKVMPLLEKTLNEKVRFGGSRVDETTPVPLVPTE